MIGTCWELGDFRIRAYTLRLYQDLWSFPNALGLCARSNNELSIRQYRFLDRCAVFELGKGLETLLQLPFAQIFDGRFGEPKWYRLDLCGRPYSLSEEHYLGFRFVDALGMRWEDFPGEAHLRVFLLDANTPWRQKGGDGNVRP